MRNPHQDHFSREISSGKGDNSDDISSWHPFPRDIVKILEACVEKHFVRLSQWGCKELVVRERVP